MKLIDIRVQEMNVTFQLCWSCIVSSAVHWCFHRNFGPESLGPPDRNFQWKNSPLRFILSVKVVTPLEIWSGSCKLERQSVVHWMHVRKSFPCLLLPHFHTSLFPSGAFLWLVGSFSPGTVLGASISAPIKAHHLFVARKTSYLRWLFFFLVTYLGSLMPLTTFSTEPYSFINGNCDQTSYSYSDHYSKSRPNFTGENGPGGPFILEYWSPEPLFSPDQNFCDSTTSLWTWSWSKVPTW